MSESPVPRRYLLGISSIDPVDEEDHPPAEAESSRDADDAPESDEQE